MTRPVTPDSTGTDAERVVQDAAQAAREWAATPPKARSRPAARRGRARREGGRVARLCCVGLVFGEAAGVQVLKDPRNAATQSTETRST